MSKTELYSRLGAEEALVQLADAAGPAGTDACEPPVGCGCTNHPVFGAHYCAEHLSASDAKGPAR